jgi:signal transduction histidine kinase
MPQMEVAQNATHAQSQLLLSPFECNDALPCADEPMALLLHELRSPLAAIQSAIAVLRIRGKDELVLQRMHDLIERQVRQITLLTSSPWQMAGPGLVNVRLHEERIDLRDVLNRAVETAAPELTQRFNQLVVSLPTSNIWVFGDAGRLEQVFVNLLSNASKYSDFGGKIVVSMRVEDGQAVIAIRDYGVGIAPASMLLIFGVFVRADAAAVRLRSGQGIGLALVRAVLDAHGGTVAAASEGIGQGSEFTVRLRIRT